MKRLMLVMALILVTVVSYAKDEAGFNRALVEYTDTCINQIKEFEIQHPYERTSYDPTQFLYNAFELAKKYKYSDRDITRLARDGLLLTQCHERILAAYYVHTEGVSERVSKRDADEGILQSKRINDLRYIDDSIGRNLKGLKRGAYTANNIYTQMYARREYPKRPNDRFLYSFIGEFEVLVEENKRSTMSSGQEKWIKDTRDILNKLYSSYESTGYEGLDDMAYDLIISKFSEYLK